VADAFDALGDHLSVEGLCQADDALDDGHVLAVVEHGADEGLVDLQGVGRQVLEIEQRGIAGAEIVERKGHAQTTAGGDHLGGVGGVMQGRGFENFKFEQAAR